MKINYERMKNKYYPISALFALAFFALVSCKEEPQSAATGRKDGFTKDLKSKKDSLYQDVMDGHDVGMAKMGKINGYLKTVTGSLDSAKKSKTAGKQHIALLESIKADLSQADYSMNRWMEEFKLDSAENNEAVRIAYLQSEKDKIDKIKERILNSIKRADSLYGQ
jgi:hypothetical protein